MNFIMSDWMDVMNNGMRKGWPCAYCERQIVFHHFPILKVGSQPNLCLVHKECVRDLIARLQNELDKLKLK